MKVVVHVNVLFILDLMRCIKLAAWVDTYTGEDQTTYPYRD